jgi:hemolysin activation/secretion protein
VRNLSFLEARGFDALAAVQDVARGFQFGVVVGRGSDTFLATDLYAGLGVARSFAALRVEAEARHDPGAHRWDAMVASGRLAWYWKPSDAHVVIASEEFSGGWRLRIPFQLRLGAMPGGVRGYRNSRVVGAVRSVVRIEERWSLGQLTRHVGLGLASFVDAGVVWAGDAPFGVNSGMKVGVGVGLLVAVPPRSKRLWRVDFATPVSPDAHARWEIRLTTLWVGGFWSEPRDVAQARAGAAPSLIFTWP